jgi:hypothetical protein
VTIFGIQHDRIGRSSLTPGRAARRPGHLRGRIRKNSQPSPAARSHRARFVRPLDTGGPYGWVPYIVRQVRHAVVVSAAGCRIGEHLGQRPAEASSGPVTPNRPDVAPRGIPTSISHWVTGKVGENAHRAAVRCASPVRGRLVHARQIRTICAARAGPALLTTLASSLRQARVLVQGPPT